MASIIHKRVENVEGNYYVDTSCIDCDTCRILATDFFAESNGQSSVIKQPSTVEEEKKVMEALLSCPSFSIGAENGNTDLLNEVKESFPKQITENIFLNGFHSDKSFGATSYLIQIETGNLLIDSPRFTSAIAERISKLGKVETIFLTHIDDVADHLKYSSYFDAKRIIHHHDLYDLKDIEIILQDDEVYNLDNEIQIIPTPGHTKGSSVLLYKNKYLFTGDHLAYSETKKHLIAFRSACWFDWKIQIQSMRKLLEFEFEYVLPGHGRGIHLEKKQMRESLLQCIQWMESV
jgi:glyoxylase-like metal-dependent hydrolase (beta-lactamase superfamily II)/ferredoxin